MKLQATIKYQVSETIKPILIFYTVLLALLFIPTLLRGTIEFRGTELATAIFIFVIGLNSFRSSFLFAQAVFHGFFLRKLHADEACSD